MSTSPAPFGTVPTAWFNSVDSFASIVAVPPLVALWAWQARRGREPASIAKIGHRVGADRRVAPWCSSPAACWPDPTARCR